MHLSRFALRFADVCQSENTAVVASAIITTDINFNLFISVD